MCAARKIADALRSMHYTFRPFTQHEYCIEQTRLPALAALLSPADAERLHCDARTIAWRAYVAFVW